MSESEVTNNNDMPTGSTMIYKWIIDFPNLLQADPLNPVYPTITRTHIYVDGYPYLQVYSYPQAALTFDIDS